MEKLEEKRKKQQERKQQKKRRMDLEVKKKELKKRRKKSTRVISFILAFTICIKSSKSASSYHNTWSEFVLFCYEGKWFSFGSTFESKSDKISIREVTISEVTRTK